MMKESRRAEPNDTVEGGKICRHMSRPYPDCYCMNISGLNIRKVILYCGNDHAACPVYRNANREKTGTGLEQ